MDASALTRPPAAGLHVAIIMDGNGRWACARGMPRAAGHAQGVEAVRRIVQAAPSLGIATLTLYTFSSDNWRRPPREVGALMRLFKYHLRAEVDRLIDNGVRLAVIGRRDRLSMRLRTEIDAAEAATAHGRTLTLRLAIDYSSRDAILGAAQRIPAGHALSRDLFARLLAQEYGSECAVSDVDLLVRTGGEQRLSDFLLWECAYAELYFSNRMWPDFDAADLAAAVHEYRARDRRFGRVPVSIRTAVVS